MRSIRWLPSARASYGIQQDEHERFLFDEDAALAAELAVRL